MKNDPFRHAKIAGSRFPLFTRITASQVAILSLFVMVGCVSGQPHSSSSPGPVYQGIIPIVDHHQHIMSERAIGPAPESAPLIELPTEIARVIDHRNEVITSGDAGDLFASDIMVLDPTSGVWLTGDEGVSEIVGLYHSGTRFFANGYTLGDSVAIITGVIRSGDNEEDALTFTLGLKQESAGSWQIASEAASLVPPRELAVPVTADDLIYMMNAVGIQKAVVLPVAYWFGDPSDEWSNEHENTRAENDWAAAEVARYPDRLIAFCGIAALREYSETEMRRCASDLQVQGVKIHLSNSKVNLHDPEHVAGMRRIFEVANELGLAIVIHTRTHRSFGSYGRVEAEIFVNEILTAAPDVIVQVAHFWGGGEVSEEALTVFAEFVSSGDPQARNLYFDLTEVERFSHGSEALVARYARKIGMDRLLYGSDMQVSPAHPPSTLGWSKIMRSIPLTNEEFADIADNIAPYLR